MPDIGFGGSPAPRLSVSRGRLFAEPPSRTRSPFRRDCDRVIHSTAFRRLVKRQGGCGLVVTEMVSSEGLVRGIGRTLEYAEYTEEERPVSVQIFGGDPDTVKATLSDGRAG